MELLTKDKGFAVKKYYHWIGIAIALGVAYWFTRRNPTGAAAAAGAAESPSIYVENSLPSLPQPKSQGTSILRPDIAIGTLGINVPRPAAMQPMRERLLGDLPSMGNPKADGARQLIMTAAQPAQRRSQRVMGG